MTWLTALAQTAAPKPSPTPKGAPKDGAPKTDATTPKDGAPKSDADHTSILDTLGHFLWTHPISIPILLIAALIGINYGWSKFRAKQALRGVAVRPLGAITRDITKFAIKEDKRPLHPKLPPKITANRVYLTLLALTILAIYPGLPGIPAPIPALAFTIFLSARYSKIAKARRAIVNQMFAVANGECRYPKGSDLAPWNSVRVTGWTNLIQPGQTIVSIPAAYQSEDMKTREKFERNFNGTVSEENAWTYKWESAKNRIICEPAAFLPTMANYPGPGDKWDEIPVGVATDGSFVKIPLSVTPHTLVCGPTGSGKLYDLNTLTPVLGGMKRLGDIKVGDIVFDAHGLPTKVTDLSAIVTPEKAYEVVFSDGSLITVGPEHLWWTETRSVRESRWTEARKPRVRRPLVSPERAAVLVAEAAAAGVNDEIMLPEAAALAGVNAGSAWVRDIAASLGPVAEMTMTVAHHYGEQTVRQEQMVTRFDAKAAFGALAAFEPNVPGWFLLREDCAKRAVAAGAGELVSAAEVAEFLGASVKTIDNLLRRAGLEGVKRPGHGKTAFQDARAAWTVVAETTSPREVAWLDKREWFGLRAEQAEAGSTVTTVELMAALDTSRQQVLRTMKSLGVPGVKSREVVELAVVEKTVSKETAPMPLYNKRLLLEALAEASETVAWDQRHKQARGAVRTTEEIRQTLRTEHGYANHSVPLAKPLQLPEAVLPIAPYTFGAWLGDGGSWNSTFVGIDHEIARLIEEDGYSLTEYLPHPNQNRHEDYRIWNVAGIRKHLRALGVLKTETAQGRTKFIPALYLRASEEQRAALLAGLLDTDGTVDPQGSVSITQVNERLARDIRELACSLGYRAVLREGRATLEGVDHGPSWTVSWTCAESPFWLSRKTAAHVERGERFSEDRNNCRYIVDVREVAPAPMRCLMVDSPDRLFLVGESMIPTHNSVLQRSVLFHILAHSDTWRLVAIDMKKVEMAWLKKYPQVLKVATTLEEAVEVLRSLREEMMRRYEEMEQEGVNHAKDLPDPPKAIFCMIDESTVLLAPEGIKSDEGKERDELHAEAGMIIGELGRLSRASMIHVMACFQRPDATFLKGETKANFDCRIAAGRMDTTPSLMVLDSEAANRLPKIRGRGMIRVGGELDTFQGFFAEQSWFDDWVASQEAAAAGGGAPEGAGSAGDVVPGVVEKSGGPSGRRGLKGLAAKAAAKAQARAERLDGESEGREVSADSVDSAGSAGVGHLVDVEGPVDSADGPVVSGPAGPGAGDFDDDVDDVDDGFDMSEWLNAGGQGPDEEPVAPEPAAPKAEPTPAPKPTPAVSSGPAPVRTFQAGDRLPGAPAPAAPEAAAQAVSEEPPGPRFSSPGAVSAPTPVTAPAPAPVAKPVGTFKAGDVLPGAAPVVPAAPPRSPGAPAAPRGPGGPGATGATGVPPKAAGLPVRRPGLPVQRPGGPPSRPASEDPAGEESSGS